MASILKARGMGLLSGSFNPLHQEHKVIRKIAEMELGVPVFYELSRTNCDKPALTPDELKERIEQPDLTPLFITEAPLYPEKARLFPEACFILGGDTFRRLWDEKYYKRWGGLDRAFRFITMNNCRFLVLARLIDGEVFKFEEELVPSEYLYLFKEIPEHRFLGKLSSTEVRDTEERFLTVKSASI